MREGVQTFERREDIVATRIGEGEVKALYGELGVEEHPMLALPTVEQVLGCLASEGGKGELIEQLGRRQRRIELAGKDPLVWGFEMETWVDADALLEGRWRPRREPVSVMERPHPNQEGVSFSPRLRPQLQERETATGTPDTSLKGGVNEKPQERENATERAVLPGSGECEVLALFGGNRAAKTYYGIKRICQLAHWYPNCLLLGGSETETQSIETVQRYVWTFLGPYYGHLSGKRDQAHKFNYSRAEGFTNRRIALPNGSVMHFPTYNQDPGLYEGWEFGCPVPDYERVSAARRARGEFVPANIGAVMDESMGLKWLHMLARRIRFRKAKALWCFTPIHGITPAIKELVGSSAVTLESRRSELLPRRNLPELPEGHMPYVRRCVMERCYAIYFFTEYTKWGNYYEKVKAGCAGRDSQYIERVAYGFARDSVARAYPKFGAQNVIARRHLPAVGTNYFFADPAGARMWFMFWVRVAGPRWGDGNWTHYIYRDWPDAQGHGEWAIATEREVSEEMSKGWDGDAGPAQAGMGYGVTKYKQVILECERVKGPMVPVGVTQERPATGPGGWEEFDALKRWEREADPQHVRLVRAAMARGESLDQVREEIAERYVDPRAGASEHIAEQGGTCIIDEFAEVQVDGKGMVTGPAMELIPASGVKGEDGMQRVNDLLDWNMEAAEGLVALLNQPHLFVCEDCLQVRWMFENFTGRAGEKGACKDPADLARYMALAKLEHYGEGKLTGRAGRGF